MIKLYWFRASHPSQAVRLAIEHKGLEWTGKLVLPGMHPVFLRAAGFKGSTVPAVDIDGNKVEGSLSIMQALERAQPSPSLYPEDAAGRGKVQEAEHWGEAVLQPIPRRVARVAMSHSQAIRVQFAGDLGVPVPKVTGWAFLPAAKVFARVAKASDETAREDLAALPGHLDHVDALLADGVIGADVPNAATFQIGATVRLLLAMGDTRPLVEGRPAEAFARALLPDYPEMPAGLPAGISA